MGMSLAPVTAWSTRMTSYTIHGCRPTSVVIHPAISSGAARVEAIDPNATG